MKIENILVIAEESIGDKPLDLRKALSLVDGKANTIHLLAVVYCDTEEHTTFLETDERLSLKQALLNQTQESIETLLQNECADLSKVTYEIQWNENLFTAAETVCRQKAFDLIIKTGHRTESLLHVPTDFHLLRVVHIPTMVLRSHGWASRPVVLATINFATHIPALMDLNRKVLNTARQVAQMTGSELHCCYVISCSGILMDMDIIHADNLLRKFRQKHEAELFDFTSEFGITPERIHARAGVPDRLIPSLANRIKANLVVIGTHHRKSIQGLVLGNKCERVLSVLRTHILVVKPE